jgi:dynein heavy chain 2
MDLNTKDGKLHVSYGDRLVTLVREVRLLLQRGFAVPGKIQHVAQVAEKFKLQGNILKQVCCISLS